MIKQRSLRPEEIDKIKQIDEGKSEYFFRDPDRPDARFVKAHGSVPPEVKRAQTRLRTARWRSELDRRKAPTLQQIGMSLAVALATTDRLAGLSDQEYGLLKRMVADLHARGFDVREALKTMRRLRNKLVDPADRNGEPTERTGMPIAIPGEAPLPF